MEAEARLTMAEHYRNTSKHFTKGSDPYGNGFIAYGTVLYSDPKFYQTAVQILIRIINLAITSKVHLTSVFFQIYIFSFLKNKSNLH